MNKLERKEAVVRVAKRLLDVPIDEVVSVRQLSEAAGHDLYAERWIIGTALRAVNSEYGAVFATVRKEGYRRLAHGNGALFAAARGLKRVRRAARAGIKSAGNAAKFANDMNAEQRRQHNQQMAALGLIDHITMARTVHTMPEESPPVPADPLAGLRAALGVAA